MADKVLDFLRHDAIVTRIKGMSGANRFIWSAKDVATICDYVMAVPEKILRAAPTAVQHKRFGTDHTRRKFAQAGVVRATQPDDRNFLGTISDERVDWANDVIKQAGIDCSDFNKNPVVLGFHDSTALPVASSTPPWLSGTQTHAIINFPQPGISDESDQVAAAVRAGLVRGLSVGVIPLQWSFTKDPNSAAGRGF